MRRGERAPVPNCFLKVITLFGVVVGMGWDRPLPTSSPSSAQRLCTEGDWEWCVLATHGISPLPPSLHFPIPAAHRGGCVRSCRGPLRCPSPAKLPSLLPQGLHTSKEWRKDPSVHWDGLGGPCHRVPSPALIWGYGLVCSLAPQASTNPHSEDTKCCCLV